MATRQPLRLAFARRLKALSAGLSAPLDRDADALHRMRVASRRLRAALPLLEPNARDPHARRALTDAGKEIRRLTASLGQVRELDVALAILDELGSRHPDLSTGIVAIRAAIVRDRSGRLSVLREHVSVGRLRKVSRFLATTAARSTVSPAPRVVAAAGLRSLADRLTKAVQHAGVLYAVDRLHEVRIATKKLRYALEIEDEIAGRSVDRHLSALKQAQATLGRLHDLDVVASYAADVARAPDTATDARWTSGRVQELLEYEIRERHAEYLGCREALLRIADLACERAKPRAPRHATRKRMSAADRRA